MRARDRAFFATCALLFIASAAVTAYWCGSMSGGMPMAGGWTMSMAWMRMPGQTWIVAAGSFAGMWMAMMMAMMLPSLVPMLSIYRRSVRPGGEAHLDRLTLLAGAGYFFVWALLGGIVYPLGVGLAMAEMRWHALARFVPMAAGVVLVLAGCVQLTPWKARLLGKCRDESACNDRNAWRYGARLGVRCTLCCAGFTMILLVAGVMNLGAMSVVAAGITVERLVPAPERAARAAGIVAIAAGTAVITLALGRV